MHLLADRALELGSLGVVTIEKTRLDLSVLNPRSTLEVHSRSDRPPTTLLQKAMAKAKKNHAQATAKALVLVLPA